MFKGLPVPGKKELPLLEKFLSEGSPIQYLSRIAVVRQFLEKNLPLSLENLRSFYRVLEGGTESSEASKGESRFPTEETVPPHAVPLQMLSNDPTIRELLENFNRRKNRKGKWAVLPFTCSLEGTHYHGCVRLFTEEGTASKVVLSVRRFASDGLPWYFVWFPHEPKRPLRMYPPFQQSKECAIPMQVLETFRKKLRKLGFILDDNKNSSTVIDGFDEIEENLQNIDVWV